MSHQKHLEKVFMIYGRLTPFYPAKFKTIIFSIEQINMQVGFLAFDKRLLSNFRWRTIENDCVSDDACNESWPNQEELFAACVCIS